MLVNWWIW